MTMPCHITQENIYNPWEEDGEADTVAAKTIYDLTLADIMGEDHGVWFGKYGKELVLEIENDKGEIIREKNVNDAAAHCLAAFCRQFLNFHNKVTGEE